MRSLRFFSVFALVTAFAAQSVVLPVRAASAPTMADALARIEAYAPQALAAQGAPGMSVAITDRGHTLRIITLGYANLDAKLPVTTATRFPIGSITKGMTATALLELRDAGRFNPAERVTAYLPWFSIHSGGNPIYVHELLSHTAGFPDDYSFAPGYMYSVAMLRQAHTIFTPGTKWSYSNDGFATAGAILAALDHRAWADSLQARVFDRLAMAQSSPVFTPQTFADAATGYAYEDMNRIIPEHPKLIATGAGDFVDPAGTVISTPEDMAKYMRFLLNGGVNDNGQRVLSRSSYALLTTPDSMNGKAAGPSTPELAEAPLIYQTYAFGLGIHHEGADKIVAHTGGIAGYTACMETNASRGFGVIAMSNLVEAPLHPCAIVLYAMQVLRAQSMGQALPAIPAEIDRAKVSNAARFAGTYTSPAGTQLVFTASGNRLMLRTASGSKMLYPRGERTFYVDDPRFAIFGLRFARNRAGKFDEVFSGGQWFFNSAYSGPKHFTYPHSWDALTGRYESDQQWGVGSATRVIVLKGELTLDGVAPLTASHNGSYLVGTSGVRFDTFAGGKAQRMWIDAIPFYRIDLP